MGTRHVSRFPKYTTVDGTFNEELCIMYYFKDKYLKYTWTKGLPHKDSKFYYECNDEITSTEADSLLTAWHLK